ncbi:hypothetical protein GLOIN_2v1695679 [Rhizophagus clarus]|nr:hypothetical protein GLOIN_2v1695679 [Rhizophagus clarus]
MNGDVSSALYVNTPGDNVTISSYSYPTTSSDPPHPLSQYTQQIQQVQQPAYQQNTENNIQQQSSNTIQPIVQNVPSYQNNSLPFNMTNSSQINYFEIFTFEFSGIKIIIIPTFPPIPIINSIQMNHSETFIFDIPGSKVIIITLAF